MKNLIKTAATKAFAVVATVVLVAGVASNALAGFGPNRETRVWTSNENGFDHVTFNSFTGVPNGIGDERDFIRGVQVGRDSVWSDPVTGVTMDSEVEMKIYIHNNADPLLNDDATKSGVAKNVTVKATLPTASAQAQQVNASISADKAQPGTITDTLDITGANNGFFELAYVPGSAKLHNGADVTALSDTLVTSGVNIGDQKGCFEYVREITFRVKVKMPAWQMQKTARLNGEASDKWRETVNTKVGDKVDWRIWFQNSGTTQLNSVKIVDDVPPFTTIVPGSVKVVNSNNPSGVVVGNDSIQKNGKQLNLDIGAYGPMAEAYVVFTTTVDNAKEISCGTHKLTNIAYATPAGYGAASDGAHINVINSNQCSTATPTYVCENLDVVKLGDRKVKAVVTAPVSGGATVKAVSINYGDGSTPKLTNKQENGKYVDEYEYKADGPFKAVATVTFTVNGSDKSVTSDACAEMVSFTTPKPATLVETGPASTIGLFAAVTVAAAGAHNLFVRRKAIR